MKTLLGKSAVMMLLAGVFAIASPLHAQTDRLIIESGDRAQSRQNAAMDKEQWNEDKCQQSANVNAYWEPNTLRCLDRRTGRQITP